jgi:CheY-like chemotaxis protein
MKAMPSQILVIEDNADNSKLVCWMLEDAGYSAEVAESAERGFELLAQQPFDLVLMDIGLPGMDGKEATRRIRQDGRFSHIPVLALTAHAVAGEVEAIYQSGVSGLITKPIEEEGLLKTLRNHLPRENADG